MSQIPSTPSPHAPNPAPAGARPSQPRRLTDKPTDESLKETFESVIIAFILAFVFRAYVVEAFVIPTGSMAPTLMGEHMHTTCSQCGYTFNADALKRPRNDNRTLANAYLVCPMCHFPNQRPATTRSAGGDRILVHKYVYSIVEPSRWDVVVFKDPNNPSENFIKRLVGLPEENIWVVEGNIYVQPSQSLDAPWSIARKTDARHGYKTQRDLWQPIYHSQYIPLDQGKLSRARQIPDPSTGWNTLDMTWQSPWSAEGTAANDWHIAGRRSYELTSAASSAITFDFDKAIDPLQTNWYPYNQFFQMYMSRSWNHDPLIPVEDVRLAAVFEPKADGLGITLATQARLENPDPQARLVSLQGVVSAEGQAWLQSVSEDGQITMLTEKANVGRFTPSQGRSVELWFVDQEATLWLAGKVVAQRRFDLPMDTIVNRPPLTKQPQLRIQVSGSPVTLHQVEVDRDIFYTSTMAGGSRPGLGTLAKTIHSHQGEPVSLARDQFFCMGDNSPLSSDGRFWDNVNPWIQQRMFEPNTQQTGVVPRKLMIGRAFFVYFPAMYPWKEGSIALIPNFGELRFIH